MGSPNIIISLISIFIYLFIYLCTYCIFGQLIIIIINIIIIIIFLFLFIFFYYQISDFHDFMLAYNISCPIYAFLT